MYMSYCRFEGTRHELAACLDVVEEHINEEAEYTVSDREICDFKRMVRMFVDFMHEQDLLDAEGELDQDALDRMCLAMAESYGEMND